MNLRPKAYESSALPLSYSGNLLIVDDFLVGARLTVADAVTARQVLKSETKSGKIHAPLKLRMDFCAANFII